MTATERPRLTSLEWKLALISVFSAIYLVAWVAVQRTLPAREVAAREPDPAPQTAWIDSLPVAQRPATQPPAGWVIATGPVAGPPGRATVQRTEPRPAPRPYRVRTRSS